MAATTTLTLKTHRSELERLRLEVLARIERSEADYMVLAEEGTDVGSGEDEGGSESDQTTVERDRLRASVSADRDYVDAIDRALERAGTKQWRTCSRCEKPIGDARLEALPTTDVCVTCKAAGTGW